MFCIFEDDRSICASDCAHTVYKLGIALDFGLKGLLQLFLRVERCESGEDFFNWFTLEGGGRPLSG
jgi:hypothetical protein